MEEHQEAVERTLWSTLVALEEAADIAVRFALDLKGFYAEEARKKHEQIAIIKKC